MAEDQAGRTRDTSPGSGQRPEIGPGRGLDDVRVEVVEQPGLEGDLDALAHPLDGGARDVLFQLASLPVHLIADDGPGGAADGSPDDGALAVEPETLPITPPITAPPAAPITRPRWALRAQPRRE